MTDQRLIVGARSVIYIISLLWLVIYIFAILGCSQFGANDPARFGTVAISMLSLFQVSTLSSWTGIADTSWYGCSNYLRSPYHAPLVDLSHIDDGGITGEEEPDVSLQGGGGGGGGGQLQGGQQHPRRVETMMGAFRGFRCEGEGPDFDDTMPLTTSLFYSSYILLTSWVIMSLFIGVISMGMFEAFLRMKEEHKRERYLDNLEYNVRDSYDSDDNLKRSEGGDNGNNVKTPRRSAMGLGKIKKFKHDDLKALIDVSCCFLYPTSDSQKKTTHFFGTSRSVLSI